MRSVEFEEEEEEDVLVGLERHLFDTEHDGDEDDELGVGATINDDDGLRRLNESARSGSDGSDSTRSANSDASSNVRSNSSNSNTYSNKSKSSSRQQLFHAVLQEQHRQHQIGIKDVEALARVSMEKSERARERARVIGIWQSM